MTTAVAAAATVAKRSNSRFTLTVCKRCVDVCELVCWCFYVSSAQSLLTLSTENTDRDGVAAAAVVAIASLSMSVA